MKKNVEVGSLMLRWIAGKWLWIVGGILLLAGFIFFFAPGVIFYRHQCIDINTGRFRDDRYILLYRVNRTIEDTPVTDALSPESLNGVEPEWRSVNTFVLWSHVSPHYSYHGAFHQVRELNMWLLRHPAVSTAAKRRAASVLLQLWREGGGYGSAGDFIRSITNLSIELMDGKRKAIDVEDIPIPEAVKHLYPESEREARRSDGSGPSP